MIQRLVILVVMAAVFVRSADQAGAVDRIALVIGNSQYTHTQTLSNPENDAKLMASVLRQRGFQVLEHRNLGFKEMKRAIKAYTSKLEALGKETVGLIFYAGHGVQSAGINYLIPVDAKIDKEGDVEIEAISSQALLSGLRFAGNKLNIIILDACRNNPYRGTFRSAARGFARMDAPVGSLVAFSTAPGTVAADGDGLNSPYTRALASAMAEPGLKIEDVFKQVRSTVYSQTAGNQVPWESSSIFGDFYFTPDGNKTGEAKADLSQNPAATAWSLTKDTSSPAVLRAFIERFSDSVYATLSKARLAELERMKTAALTTSQEPSPEPADLALPLQKELARVGCDPGRPDGNWGRKSRNAMAAFNRQTNSALPTAQPTSRALEIVKARTDRVCKPSPTRPAATKKKPAAKSKVTRKSNGSDFRTRCKAGSLSACQEWCRKGSSKACAAVGRIQGRGR